jgi:hypothetical protein
VAARPDRANPRPQRIQSDSCPTIGTMNIKKNKTTRIPTRALIKKVDSAKLAESNAIHVLLPEDLRKILIESTWVQSTEVAFAILGQLIDLQRERGTTAGKIEVALETMKEMAPANLTEAMLAVQMIGVHNAAVRFLHRSLAPNQTIGGVDSGVSHATKLLRLFTEQLSAMAKLKGKSGQQKMTIEHVHVHAGGQAIVGPVGPPSGAASATGEAK